jgi:hypothetical protein
MSKKDGDERKGPKTVKDRTDEKRREKLAAIRAQVKEGTLTIRKMTPAERKAFPAQPRGSKKG